MKHVILLVFVISIGSYLHTMEIEHTVRDFQRTPLLNMQSKYGSFFSQPYKVSKKKIQESYSYNIMRLPMDIQIRLFSKLFEISDKKLTKKLCGNPILIPVGLRCFYEAQVYCPLRIGNKVLAGNDLLKMTHEDRKAMIKIGNPSKVSYLYGISTAAVSPEDYEIIKKMPPCITDNLEINMVVQNPIISNEAIGFWSRAIPFGLSGGGVAWGLAFAAAGCQCSTSFWITGSVMLVVLGAIPVGLCGLEYIQPCLCKEQIPHKF